ncbi:MAG TPA: P-loop NTPase fold protein [Longimicrobium sp.]|jgi:hypothetical protein|uniref:KAP family P-loop NTPase fold protein n=1 Tax=Longimicrobium sp. TaxID=2029185 RepID=UPI002EDB5163
MVQLHETGTEPWKSAISRGRPEDLLLSHDDPITHPRADHYQRDEFAGRVVERIRGRTGKGSVVLGLYGAWGDGKTTVLNFIEHRLRQRPEMVVVRFNPWRFNGEEALLRSFFEHFAQQLDPPYRSRLRRSFARVLEFLSLLVTAVFGSAAGGGGLEISPGHALRRFSRRLSAPDLDREKRRIDAALESRGQHVVVLMDDLDRLEKAEIRAVFRLVKLTADFHHTTFVLAFDPRLVSRALGKAYDSRHAGTRFLEKIVQVPLHLPAMNRKRLQKHCLAAIHRALGDAGTQLSPAEAAELEEKARQGFGSALSNPRIAHRFLNLVKFSVPALHGEVNTVDQVLVEGMRICYPSIYDAVRTSREFLIELPDVAGVSEIDRQSRRFEAGIGIRLRALAPAEREEAEWLLRTLFPQLSALARGELPASDQPRWIREQRVCCEPYFDRCFTYTLLPGDISDQDIKELVGLAYEHAAEALGPRLTTVLASVGSREFHARLMRHHLPGQAASQIARAIATHAGAACGADPGTPALFSALIARVHQTGRTNFAADLARFAEPFSMGAAVFRAMRLLSDDSGHHDAIGRVLAQRAQDRLEGTLHPPADAPLQYLLWARYGDRERAKSWLSEVVLSHPHIAVALPAQVVEWTAEPGQANGFGAEDYQHLHEISEPGVVHQAISMWAQTEDGRMVLGFPGGKGDLLRAFAQLHGQWMTARDARGEASREQPSAREEGSDTRPQEDAYAREVAGAVPAPPRYAEGEGPPVEPGSDGGSKMG